VQSRRPSKRVHVLGSGLLALLALLAAGCGERGLAPVRALTYPPDFNYITRSELQGTMAEFARDVDALDALLSRDGGAGVADRAAIAGILEHMRGHARALDRGTDSNHPHLQPGAERFALDGIRRDPPDFSGVGRLTGGCTACHAPRHPGAA
jgi:hypothetical protein